ncbi:MAG: hypothetical protein JW821_11705, partial [Deltaproteobacteria bacterium]|nr:hypothetical protein [Deltaproteobacteria bacterium]
MMKKDKEPEGDKQSLSDSEEIFDSVFKNAAKADESGSDDDSAGGETPSPFSDSTELFDNLFKETLVLEGLVTGEESTSSSRDGPEPARK